MEELSLPTNPTRVYTQATDIVTIVYTQAIDIVREGRALRMTLGAQRYFSKHLMLRFQK